MGGRELKFRLVLVTSRGTSRLPLEDAIRLAVEGGVDCVQLREKSMSGLEFFRMAERLRKVTADAGCALVINHHVDVAIACGADGVHLGWRSMRASEARKLLGEEQVVGVSTHSLKEVRTAERGGADYISLGPIFHTPSKKGLVPAVGIEGLRRICAATWLSVIAIGGIEPEKVQQVLAAGAKGVAVIRFILDRDDPGRAASELRGALESAS